MSERLTAKSAKKVLEIAELKNSADEAEKRSADKKLLKFNSKLTEKILSAASNGEGYLGIEIQKEEIDFLLRYSDKNGFELYGYEVNFKELKDKLESLEMQLEEITSVEKNQYRI